MKRGKRIIAPHVDMMKYRKTCIDMSRRVDFTDIIKNKRKDKNKRYKTIFYPSNSF
jgi:hypothetical protein